MYISVFFTHIKKNTTATLIENYLSYLKYFDKLKKQYQATWKNIVFKITSSGIEALNFFYLIVDCAELLISFPVTFLLFLPV